MKHLLLVLLASMWLSCSIAFTSDYHLPAPSRFTTIDTEEGSLPVLLLPGKQVRFLPNGIVSIAEYRQTGRDMEDPSSLIQEPISAQYEAMVWNWEWETSEITTITYKDQLNELWYHNIQPGIHVKYFLTESGALKYDVILEPGTQAKDVGVHLTGASFQKIDRHGRLIISTPWGKSRDEAPVSFMESMTERSMIRSSYSLTNSNRLSFEVEATPTTGEKLIIDPITMSWSSFLHSASSDDYMIAVVRDGAGFVYVAGYTETPSFPVTSGVYQGSFAGQIDAYVAKMSPDGDNLLWSTYLGGSNWDLAHALDIDSDGNLYVGGYTASSDFPITQTAAQTIMRGYSDGFVACLSPDGSTLQYATYLGGTDRDYLYDLVSDSTGNVIVCGYTFSYNFPITSGAYDGSYNGFGDGYVACISPDGNQILFSSYIGGTGFDICQAVDWAPDGTIGVVGNTNSTDLPVHQPLQNSLNLGNGNGTDDGFFLKLNHNASQLLTGTFIGGSGSDGVYAIQSNTAGEWFLAGNTFSANLVPTYSAYQTSYQGAGDVFIMRLDATGTSAIYSTYLGGTDVDYVKSIVVDEDDEAYVVGATRSTDWPVTGGLFGPSGQYDTYLTHVNADASVINSSTLMGGSYNDYPRSPSSVSLHGSTITIAVTTHSPNIQSAGNGYQKAKLNGLADAPWLVAFEGDIILPSTSNTYLKELKESGPVLLLTSSTEAWSWSLDNPEALSLSLSIWDLNGRELLRFSSNREEGPLPIPHLPSGCYIVKALREDGQQFVNQLIKL